MLGQSRFDDPVVLVLGGTLGTGTAAKASLTRAEGVITRDGLGLPAIAVGRRGSGRAGFAGGSCVFRGDVL